MESNIVFKAIRGLYLITVGISLFYLASGSMLIQFKVGQLSLSALSTVIVILCFVAILFIYIFDKKQLIFLKQYLEIKFEDKFLWIASTLFIIYAGISVILKLNFEGFQNLLAESLFFIGVIAFSLSVGIIQADKIWVLVVYISFVHASIMVATKFFDHNFIDNRSYAMVSLFGLVAAVFSEKNNFVLRIAPYVIFFSILFSASRTASFAAAFVMCFIFVDFSKKSQRVVSRGIAGILFSAISSVAVYTFYNPAASRIVSGDQAISIVVPSLDSNISESNISESITSPSVLSINTNGRIEAWTEFLNRLNEPMDWIFGLGTGSSAQYGRENIPFFPQVLNEYLRILIDNGVIGITLFFVAIVAILNKLIRSRSFDNSAYITAGIVSILVLLIISLTDGAFVYPFSSLPAALLIGLSMQTSFKSSRKTIILVDNS